MRRFLWAVSALVIAAAGLADASSTADAKSRKAYRPLIVTKRSFLDAGKQVPVGYGTNYVTDSTSAGRPTFGGSFSSDRFGGNNLPGRFFAPGRPQPVAQFYTPTF